MKVARPEYLEQFIGKTSADEVASISGATSSSDVLKRRSTKPLPPILLRSSPRAAERSRVTWERD